MRHSIFHPAALLTLVSALSCRPGPSVNTPEVPTPASAAPTFGQAVGVTSFVIGPDPNAPPNFAVFTGLILIHKWPEAGFTTTGLSDGRRQITARLASTWGSTLSKRMASLRSRYAGMTWFVNPERPSNGTITQQTPGQEFPVTARFELYLKGDYPPSLEGYQSTRTLHNEVPVILEGNLTGLPPVVEPFRLTGDMPPDEVRRQIESLGGRNVFSARNLSVPLLDERGNVAAFFTPAVHITVLAGTCGDRKDTDRDGSVDEERPNNQDDDGDGLADEDATCPAR